MFWVISVYFNIRNTLPKSGTFLLGHPVYTQIHILLNLFFLYLILVVGLKLKLYVFISLCGQNETALSADRMLLVQFG